MQGCSDQKSLFTFLDKVCHRKHLVLRELQPAQLVASFYDYFVRKITGIRKYTDERTLHLLPDLPELDTDEAGSSFTTFCPVSVLNVEKIVS